MKLNAKNYEWILFDLLEGNLSHQDELLVMEQIEESEFLFKEWKLLKQTKISTDDQGIVITDESSVIDFKRNWLINEYVTIPMLLNLNFALQKGKKKEVHVLAGANFAYALQSRIRQKWESEDMKYVRRGKKDLNVNQFQVGYEVQLGFKNFMLYGNIIQTEYLKLQRSIPI